MRIAFLLLPGAALAAEEAPSCDFSMAFSHMQTITAKCCSGDSAGTTCQSEHPDIDNVCSRDCGLAYEPFIDQCGETLKAAGMGWDGLDDFYINCLEALYPPGRSLFASCAAPSASIVSVFLLTD